MHLSTNSDRNMRRDSRIASGLPNYGRFLQADPIGYADNPNLYAYVGNDPINFVDPMGLETCPSDEKTKTQKDGSGGDGNCPDSDTTVTPSHGPLAGQPIIPIPGENPDVFWDAFGGYGYYDPAGGYHQLWFNSHDFARSLLSQAGYSKWGPVFGNTTPRSRLGSRGVLTARHSSPFADIDRLAHWNGIPCLCMKGFATGVPKGWIMGPIGASGVRIYHSSGLQLRIINGRVAIDIMAGMQVGPMAGELSENGEVVHYDRPGP